MGGASGLQPSPMHGASSPCSRSKPSCRRAAVHATAPGPAEFLAWAFPLSLPPFRAARVLVGADASCIPGDVESRGGPSTSPPRSLNLVVEHTVFRRHATLWRCPMASAPYPGAVLQGTRYAASRPAVCAESPQRHSRRCPTITLQRHTTPCSHVCPPVLDPSRK